MGLIERIAHQHSTSNHRRAAACDVGSDTTLSFTVGNDSWTWRSDGQDISFEPLQSSGIVVHCSIDAIDDLLSERQSIFGLLYGGRLTLEGGSINRLSMWEPAIQALLYNRPIWSAQAITPLHGFDLTQNFALDDDAADMRRFLNTAGFIHIRNVFDPIHIDAMIMELESLRQLAHPNDKKSWWATDANNHEVCCRVTYANDQSDVFADLPFDTRMLTIAALAGKNLKPAHDRMDGVSGVCKIPRASSGMADLPWHRDCGMGGHPLLCPGLIIGIQLDDANADNGQLRFLAGSTDYANRTVDDNDPSQPIVAVNTNAGDVTAHYCHTMHIAPPPLSVKGNRRVIYCGYHQEKLFDTIGPRQAYNDVLFSQGDGRIETPNNTFT